MQPVTIHSDRKKTLKLLLMGVVLEAASVLTIIVGSARQVAVGVFGVAFFGLGLLFLAYRLFSHRPIFEIDDDGYIDRSSLLAPGRVRWSEVRRVRIIVVKKQRMLAVEPADAEAIMRRVSPLRRWMMRLNRGMGFEVLNIGETTIPYPLETLIEVMRQHNPGLVVESAA